MNTTATINPLWQDYWQLCKPKVVALMIVTSIVGMLLASPSLPSMSVLVYGNLGIALAAFAAAAINHVIDRKIDTKMARTVHRPVAAGRVKPWQAIAFATIMAIVGLYILQTKINYLTAILSFVTLFGYAVFYTVFLKRTTPQNIVIGGAAGAAPPLLGWAAITNSIDPHALLLVLIIFTWTPPHFWALAIFREKDYKKANIPMLPITHGIKFTKLCIFLYTLLLVIVTILPYLTGMSSWFYMVSVSLLNIRFMQHAWKLLRGHDIKQAWKTFSFSIVYLLLLFVALLVDHYLPY